MNWDDEDSIVPLKYGMIFSRQDGKPCVVQVYSYELYDLSDVLITEKLYDSELEAQNALDHLQLLVSDDKLPQLVRWMKGNT